MDSLRPLDYSHNSLISQPDVEITESGYLTISPGLTTQQDKIYWQPLLRAQKPCRKFDGFNCQLLSVDVRDTKLKPRWDAHMAEVKWRQQAVL